MKFWNNFDIFGFDDVQSVNQFLHQIIKSDFWLPLLFNFNTGRDKNLNMEQTYHPTLYLKEYFVELITNLKRWVSYLDLNLISRIWFNKIDLLRDSLWSNKFITLIMIETSLWNMVYIWKSILLILSKCEKYILDLNLVNSLINNEICNEIHYRTKFNIMTTTDFTDLDLNCLCNKVQNCN
jgi:hypothetical protein